MTQDYREEVQKWWDSMEVFLAGTKFQDCDDELMAMFDKAVAAARSQALREAEEAVQKPKVQGGLYTRNWIAGFETMKGQAILALHAIHPQDTTKR